MNDNAIRIITSGANDSRSVTQRPAMIKPLGVLMLLTMLSISACGTLTQELEQEGAASVETTTSIKAKLVESEAIDAAAVRVELKEDVLVLSGFVASEEEAAEVVGIAEQEAGQYTVKNELVVK